MSSLYRFLLAYMPVPFPGDHEGGGGHSGLHFSREGVRRLSGALMGASQIRNLLRV